MLTLCFVNAWCQDLGYYVSGLDITAEAQYSHSDGTTPLWLNANRYGLSSLESKNGYFRASAIRPIETDTTYNWRVGYGVDLAVAGNYASTVILNQAFAQVAYKKASITLGSKYRESPYTNQELSSGALAYGWNSRPIPQATLDIDWFSFPGTKGWWKWKIHGSYGLTTDDSWQKRFSNPEKRYTENTIYHEKALYWKFGKEESRIPLTYEFGLQMAAFFGGTTYNLIGRGLDGPTTLKHHVNFKTFIDILTVSGSDVTDGSSKNTEGNHVGSWIMRLAWQKNGWKVAGRFERVFEDQSMMFIQYGIYDHLLGFDVEFPQNKWLSAITVEHISTTNQSGAINHDKSSNIPDKMNGRDDYYNHGHYTGYQHWGQAIGSPLLTSPIYNNDGNIYFTNNRLNALHIGLKGNPISWLSWRVLATFSKNRGTYQYPFDENTSQNYYLIETTICPKSWKGWLMSAAFGIDQGKMIGNNKGGQITVSKTISLHR